MYRMFLLNSSVTQSVRNMDVTKHTSHYPVKTDLMNMLLLYFPSDSVYNNTSKWGS